MFDSLKKKLASIRKKDEERVEESSEEEVLQTAEDAEETVEVLPDSNSEENLPDEDIPEDDDFWDDEAFWKNDAFFEDGPEDEPVEKKSDAPKKSPPKQPVHQKEKPAPKAIPQEKPKEEEIKQPVHQKEKPAPKAIPQEKPKEEEIKQPVHQKEKPVAEQSPGPDAHTNASEKKGFFAKRAEKKYESASSPKAGRKIDQGDIDDLLWELELGLLESDVALPEIEAIKEGVKQSLSERQIERGENLGDVVETALKTAIGDILQSNEFDFDRFVEESNKPAVVMFVGVNGTGKTTSIAKLANRLQNEKKTVVLAASDTFRAGAIEQLTIHSNTLGVKIIKHNFGADPAAVAYDAVEHARSKHKDVVLVDTAGRMQTNTNLMDEMKKIKRVVKPDLVIFVGDALAGNDAVEQARAFNDAINIDAIILTKIDADAKGGAALSIAHAIGKPIAFVSTGQEYEDIIKFDSKWMLDRLFSD